MHSLQRPSDNRLIGAWPPAEYAALAPHLEQVTLPLGAMLYQPGGQMPYAVFPTTAIVSLHYVTEAGDSAAAAGVGREGMVGLPLFLGGDTTASSAVVQTAGQGWRLERHRLRRAFEAGGVVQRVLLRYAQALMTEVAQTAACNRHHSVEQQLARWLLLTLDRSSGRDLVMTHELVASMLGVRRESITEAAGRLQRAGYIGYRRGHISVHDRQGLQTRVCECYDVVRRELNRLMDDLQYRQDD
jgi:CRP-like cAMP-binding protein